jgi:hypothetical protein
MTDASLQRDQEAIAYSQSSTQPIADSSIEAGDCIFVVFYPNKLEKTLAKIKVPVPFSSPEMRGCVW